ncbi:MAG: DUF2099 family protein [Methanomicrobiales archaeon]|nr:DUF2099 family protein [Methanomicrobiales archaeon]
MVEKDEHVLEAIGRARVVIREGRVVEVGPPLIRHCPLARRFAQPVTEMTSDAIRANMEERIRGYGMCTDRRQLISDRDFVLFGASELISNALQKHILDCAVIVCDGAGTVLLTDPFLVQGIGGRMSGLLFTTPIPAVIRGIRDKGGRTLSPDATIDQYAGTALAYHLGFDRVAVTVADPKTAAAIRKDYPESLLFGVHLTGLSANAAEMMAQFCDLLSSCASKEVRAVAGKAALFQAGGSVPIFALTRKGKDLILEKLRETNTPLFVKAGLLPVELGEQPEPLI